MACNVFLDWLDKSDTIPSRIPLEISRHISGCPECRSIQNRLASLRDHSKSMTPTGAEAASMWESLLRSMPVSPEVKPPNQHRGKSSPVGTSSMPPAGDAVASTAAALPPSGIGPLVILAVATIFIGIIEVGISRFTGETPPPLNIPVSTAEEPRQTSASGSPGVPETSILSSSTSEPVTRPAVIADRPAHFRHPAKPFQPGNVALASKTSAVSASGIPEVTTDSTASEPNQNALNPPHPSLPENTSESSQAPSTTDENAIYDGFIPVATSHERLR